MATLSQIFTPNITRTRFIKKRDKLIEKLIPRPCMVISVGLILAGLSIPIFMIFEVIQPNLLLCFLGLGFIAVGGVMALIFCGEI
jgi:hypothetical protein